MLKIKKFEYAVEVHIERKKSQNFKECKRIYTFTPEEWQNLKDYFNSKGELGWNT